MQLFPVPQNLILRAASRARLPHLARKLRHINFETGQELCAPQTVDAYAVFPLRGLLSLQIVAAPGRSVEIGLVGREGFAGLGLSFGAANEGMCAVALAPGEAMLMPAAVFRAYEASPGFRTAVERYTHLFLTMVAHGSACNRIHVIEEFCTSRLLQMQDRTQSDHFHLTQDSLSRHLGVRRASVNRALVQLQRGGKVRYDRRGQLTIADRRGLEDAACSCYHAIKTEFDRLVEAQGGM
jgi:CRP-like cAMP-binding protein